MKKETWKDIKGFEGFYQVSNMGNVRSIAVRRSIHGIVRVISRERTLSPYNNGNGYLMVQLKRNNHIVPVGVHRLVAEAFLPDHSPDKNVINHKDHDRANNNANNLEWVTQQENVDKSRHLMKRPKTKCKASNTGEKYIHNANGSYRVAIRAAGVNRTFKTLPEAIDYRDSIIDSNPGYFERG